MLCFLTVDIFVPGSHLQKSDETRFKTILGMNIFGQFLICIIFCIVNASPCVYHYIKQYTCTIQGTCPLSVGNKDFELGLP